MAPIPFQYHIWDFRAVQSYLKRLVPDAILVSLDAIRRHHRRNEVFFSTSNRTAIAQFNAAAGPKKLELGSGDRRGANGWHTVDIFGECDIKLDLLGPFPFPDNSVAKIYSSHLIEHFYFWELEHVLSECQRVLEPDGEFSVCVPNAEVFINAYVNGDGFEAIECEYPPAYFDTHSRMDVLNYISYMRDEHRYMFDQESLVNRLKVAGFKSVTAREFDPSLDLEHRRNTSIFAVGFV